MFYEQPTAKTVTKRIKADIKQTRYVTCSVIFSITRSAICFIIRCCSFVHSCRWGRRWPLITFHIVSGIALLLTQVIPKQTGTMAGNSFFVN